jgi:hypothetical protein
MAECWLVTQGDYSDYRVLAAFTAEDKAAGGAYDDADVESVPLDPTLPAVPAGLRGYCVPMCPVGGARRVQRADSWKVLNGEHEDRDCDRRRHGPSEPNPFVRYFYMLARDEKHAVKIANERRAMLLAGPEPWPPLLVEPPPPPYDPARAIRVTPP